MTKVELAGRPRLAARAMLRHDEVRQAELLLLPERVVRLNHSGAAILRLCDGSRTVEELVSRLGEEYDAHDLGPDVLRFLADAQARGWVVIT